MASRHSAIIQKILRLSRLSYLALFGLLQFSVIAAIAAPPLLAGAEQKSAKPDLSQRTEIRFVTGTDFAPFNMLSADGRLSGYHIDLIRAICQQLALGDRCQIAARPWQELMPTFSHQSAGLNEFDAVVAGIQPTRQNRAILSFSRPYLSLPARFIAAKQQAEPRRAVAPDQQHIGIIAGSAHQALLESYFPAAKITAYPNHAALYQALKTGKIELIFGDAMSASRRPDFDTCCQFIGKAYPAPYYLGNGMAIALRHDDTQLRQAIDYALTALERNGTLNDLYLRYFPVGFY